MIDHTSFSVNNYDESIKFYDETLKILGCTRIMNFDMPNYQVSGYGKDNKPSFWIAYERKIAEENKHETIGQARGFHVAFLAPSVEAVNGWYEKCLELGGKDNGKPGPRSYYHPGYYGAFIVDPNGWRIEACLHNYKE